jgi:hypothetical protein
MKASILFCLMITLIIFGCIPRKRTPVEGTWQVVSWQNMAGDSLVWKLGVDYVGTEMKIWTKDHFAFAGRYKQDTTFIDNCGGGSFTLDGTHCQESYLYFPDQAKVGTTQRLLLEIKNDTLIQTWPVDEKWQVVKSKYNIQKLTRLE